MRRSTTADIRDIVFVSQSRSGKTSLAEAMLFTAGATTRLGKVQDGNSVLDFEPEEQKRQSSIFSALHNFKWKNREIFFVDTPGDANFQSEAILGLKAAENAVFVLSAIGGIKPHTEHLWELATELGLTRTAFVNKLDREHADYRQALSDIKEQLEIKPLPLTLPIGSEENLSGVVDVLKKQALIYKKDGSGEFEVAPVPDSMETEVANTYMQLVEDLAETDDDLMEKYLEGAELSQDELSSALRSGLKHGLFLPVFIGAALPNIGVQPLMDFIADSMAAPGEAALPDLLDENGKTQAIRPDESAPFLGYVFKTMSDPYTGTLSIIRCLAGSLHPDASVFNANKSVRERVGALLSLEGKAQKPLEQVGPGDIFAVAKLKETKTGDTLAADEIKLSLPRPHFPEAILGMAVTPKTKADVDKILPAIQKLMDEDPVLRVHRDEQTSEFILSGLGQLHIEITVDRLKRRYGVAVDLKPPKVPYKETITASAKVQGRHKKQTGGHGQYGDCWIEVQPLPRGSGFEFVDHIVGGAIPRNYIPAIEKGIVEAMHEGPLIGSPMVDLRVTLYDGSYHDVDSSEMAFKIAGALAFRKAMETCRPILLEPIVELVVTVPEDAMGEVMGDLNGRRGKIEGMVAKGKHQELKAQVPLAEVLTYASELTSMTSGRGSFGLKFSHLEPVPYNLQEKLIKEGHSLKDAQQ